MKKINGFFFPLEEGEKLHPSDAVWWYGGLISMIAITVFTVLNVS